VNVARSEGRILLVGLLWVRRIRVRLKQAFGGVLARETLGREGDARWGRRGHRLGEALGLNDFEFWSLCEAVETALRGAAEEGGGEVGEGKKKGLEKLAGFWKIRFGASGRRGWEEALEGWGGKAVKNFCFAKKQGLLGGVPMKGGGWSVTRFGGSTGDDLVLILLGKKVRV